MSNLEQKYFFEKAKGAMLYQLTESFWISLEKGVLWDREEQEDAILVILKNIQTKKEFKKVIERMTVDGSKGNFHRNIYRLTGLLDGSQFRAYLKHREELTYLLQENNYPALPASMQPIRQRVAYV